MLGDVAEREQPRIGLLKSGVKPEGRADDLRRSARIRCETS